MGALIDEIGGVVRLLAGDRTTITAQVPPTLEINADRDQIFRVLVNLARNAAEAGASQIKIVARVDGADLTLDIIDDGPGLPPRARAHLFQPFTGSARSGGTGLGLAIARDLLRAHGGDLELVESAAAGTVFRMTLPRAVRSSPMAESLLAD